ncbi:MAG TPA: S8 family serine peptidase [bacterium]
MRFRDDSLLSATAARLEATGQSFQSLTGDPYLDGLNARFKVRRFERLLEEDAGDGLPQGPVTVEAARAALHEAQVAREARLDRLGKEFPRRLDRAPAAAAVPSLAGVYRVVFEDAGVDVPAACAAYARDPQVRYAQPNHLNRPTFSPDDPYYASAGSWGQPYDDLWGVKKLDPEPAWDLTRGAGAVVAVLDTGIDYNHPDIRDNVLRDGTGAVIGYDFSDGDADPKDVNGHGTHVAGTIAAAGNNGVGVIGVAPLAKIMPLKIFDNATDAVCAAAIKYAADHGADVLNNSWGPTGARPSNPLLEETVAYAHALGCVVVFAAGNDSADVAAYSPNNHPAAIAVGATDRNDVSLAFSNFGARIAVSAPGGGARDLSANYGYVNILSLRAEGTDLYQKFGPGLFAVGGTYYRAQGTSMAAPHVSGVAALLAALHPDWSNDLIAGQIIGSADPVASDVMGSGRVNAYAALTASPRPFVKYLDCLVDDDRPGNSVNGQPEAGETLALVFTLKNVWAAAGDVRVRLASLDPVVTVQDADAVFGALRPGEMKDNAADPFVVSVSPGAALGERCRFELEIAADGEVFRNTFEFRLPLPSKPGWPVSLTFPSPAGADADALLADLDRDGAQEVLLAGDMGLNVFRGDGSAHAPWPLAVSEDPFADVVRMAAGDIDGDSDLEIVVLVREPSRWPGQASIKAFHQESGLPVAGWPVFPKSALGLAMYPDELALADVDGDGVKDVVACGADYPPWVGVFRGDGTALPGWPVELSAPGSSDGGFIVDMGLAVGRLDGAWRPEIVVTASRETPGAHPEPRPSPLWVLRFDGKAVAGWPRLAQGSLGDPVLANLDGGRGLEILVGEKRLSGSRTHAYKLDGGEVPGWPAIGSEGPLAAADLEGDGRTEVILNEVTAGMVRVIEASGAVRWTLPLGTEFPLGAPSIADVDGDGVQEIVLSTCFESIAGSCVSSRITVLSKDAAPVAGFPAGESRGVYSQPAVGDIDGDGSTDFVSFLSRWPGAALAFTNHRPFTSPPEWPQWRRSAARTSANPSGSPPAPLPVVNDGGAFTKSADTLEASWYFQRSGVEADRFAYAIGSAPGLADVTPWRSVGLRLSTTRGGLALAHGKKYYFTVRAIAAGLPPFEGHSDGITADLRAPVLENRTIAGFAIGKAPALRARALDGVSGVRDVSVRLRATGQYVFGAPRAMTYDALGGEYVLRLAPQTQPRCWEYIFTARDRAGNVRRSPVGTLRIWAQ